MSTLTLTPKSAITAVTHCVNHRIIPHLSAPPGVGKSSVVYQAAQLLAEQDRRAFYRFNGNSMHSQEEIENGYGFIDLRANMMTTMDLYGLPTFTDDKQAYMFARPDMIPEAGQGIIFVDELPQASQSTMGGFSEAFLDHRIGKHVIPPGWNFVSAGNRQKDRADAHKIPTHIKDRMNELPLEFSLPDWVEWASTNNVHPATVAFAKYRPNLLDSFDPTLETNCTPRSITKASQHIDAPDTIRFALLSGAIGEGPAGEMEAMIRIFKELPDPEYIMDQPAKAPIPKKLDILYAVTSMLSSHTNAKNFGKYMKYISRIDQIEFQAAYVRESLFRDTNIGDCPELLDFARKNAEIMAF